jgi:regulator of protease activity HflC (stomatin/prohibitin superfamily)
MYYWISAGIVLIFVLFLSGMRVVRPTTGGLVEWLGNTGVFPILASIGLSRSSIGRIESISPRSSVFDYKYQIVNLARTTLRNIIGTSSLTSLANWPESCL